MGIGQIHGMGPAVLGLDCTVLLSTPPMAPPGRTSPYPVPDFMRSAPGSPVLDLVQHHVHRAAKAGQQRVLGSHAAVRRSGRHPCRAFAYRLLHRSEEHTSELQSLMRISYAVFCLKKKTRQQTDKREARTKS